MPCVAKRLQIIPYVLSALHGECVHIVWCTYCVFSVQNCTYRNTYRQVSQNFGLDPDLSEADSQQQLEELREVITPAALIGCVELC